MSYILDALRKADAQRERDPARGIHAQSVTALPSDRYPERASRLGWLGAGVAGAALLAVALWWLSRPDARVVEAPALSPAPTSAPVVAVAPPPPAAAASGVATPAPAAEVLPAAPPMRAPPPVPPAPPVSPVSPAPSVSTAPTAPAVVDPARSAPTQPAPAPAGDRLLSIADLPADVQRDLPKLTITGGVYSADPATRLLIVNGQVLNEGTEAAPGVVLTQIRPKTAVLTFRGWRYGVNY